MKTKHITIPALVVACILPPLLAACTNHDLPSATDGNQGLATPCASPPCRWQQAQAT